MTSWKVFASKLKRYWANRLDPLVAEDFLEDEIKKEQRKSEKSISILQLVFVSSITILWILGAKAKGVSSEVPVTPIVLAVYFIFILCRLYWAHKNLVNEAVVFISIFFDVAMLTLFIGALPYQYGMSADFSLRSPNFVHYFIFIALRAFRHETRYVLWTGALSAMGWASLTFIAYNATDVQTTSNFTEYGLPQHLLLGAEIEKVVALIAFSCILAFVVLNGRRLLIRSVRQFRISRSLSRFFSPEVVEHINSSQHAIKVGTGRLRASAILSIDIRGFSKLSAEINPNQLMQLLNEYQKIVIAAVHKHSGSIDKFMGDGVLCHFGATNKSKTYAADALRCIDQLQVDIEKWNQERVRQGQRRIYLGSALAVGIVIFGAVGDDQRMEFTTIGETVNIASKIEKMNRVLGVAAVATARAYELAENQGYAPEKKASIKKYPIDGLAHPTINLAILHEQSDLAPQRKAS